MPEAELQKSNSASQGAGEVKQPQQPAQSKDVSQLLSAFGGFNAIRGFMPDADNLNPARKAAKAVFLSDKRFKDKRENLINDIKGWLEILNEGHESASEFVDACKAKEDKYTKVLSQGITDALYATANLERSYRALDSFFKNANTDKVKNLRIINVYKDDIADSDSGFAQEVDTLLRNGFDRLSLKDCYSLMVVPGNVFQDKPTLLQWAKIAFKYKVMLITDHADEYSFDDLQANTEGYRDSDIELQNVIMTANWLVGRDSEKLSEDEKESPAFYICSSGALAGKLYDESANIDKYALDPYSQFTKFYRPPFIEQFSAGVSARVELVLPIFSVDFGIGRNFVCRGDDTDGFYQIAALKASLTRHLFIHVGYQLYRFHEPNNLMLGLGWRFGSGKR